MSPTAQDQSTPTYSNTGGMILGAGQTSGFKVFQTGFTPVQVFVYNETQDADVYYSMGASFVNQIPATATKVPAGIDVGLPFTQNEQAFTLFWKSKDGTPLAAQETVNCQWSNKVLNFNFAALIQQVAGTVNIGTMPNVTVEISGAGNTVSLASGTTVSISGSVTVTGTVNIGTAPTLTVNISGSGNTVQLQAGTTVGITGTVAVSGTVNIGTAPTLTVAISSAGNTVSLASGTTVSISGSVTVTGTVNIGTAPTLTVNISGSGNTVQLQAGTTVNIGSVTGTVTVAFSGTQNVAVTSGTVNATLTGSNVTIDTKETALQININNLVLLSQAQVTVTNLANGGSFLVVGDINNTYNYPLQQMGLYDGFVFVVYTAQGYAYSGPASVSAVISSAYPAIPAGYAITTPPSWTSAPTLSWAGGGDVGYATWLSSVAIPALFANFVLTNNTGATIANDTVTGLVFGIKAQVSVSNTVQSNIANTTGAPGYVQASAGSFDTISGTNAGSGPTGSSSEQVTLVAPGNYIKTLQFGGGTFQSSSAIGSVPSIEVYIALGGQILQRWNATATQSGYNVTLTIPPDSVPRNLSANGVANAGVTVTVFVTEGVTVAQFSYGDTYAVIAAATPAQRTATIV